MLDRSSPQHRNEFCSACPRVGEIGFAMPVYHLNWSSPRIPSKSPPRKTDETSAPAPAIPWSQSRALTLGRNIGYSEIHSLGAFREWTSQLTLHSHTVHAPIWPRVLFPRKSRIPGIPWPSISVRFRQIH